GPAEEWVKFTLQSKAREKSAYCLDGSIPGYHFRRGFGSGSNSWLLHIEGGGWCNKISDCSIRKTTSLGSSNYMEKSVPFLGILSREPDQNPDFFNWNMVKIRYCDASSLSSHPDNEFKFGSKLFFRGQIIWDTLMEELLPIGMAKAKRALLAGCSAGGLAALIHCDHFRDLLPKKTNVKCLADGSFFINEKDIAGNNTIQAFYDDIVGLHGIAKSLNRECVAKNGYSKCFFPEEFIRYIRTPVFLVQPAYDFWQINHILVPPPSLYDDSSMSTKCRRYILDCNSDELQILQDFRNSLLDRLSVFRRNPKAGVFVNSCFLHCQTLASETWHSPTSPRINNRTVAEAVGDWYFERAPAIHVDCPYPCNPTCHHRR
ncbi:hypothetical protein M569_05022, partial [Genlisea aurea]